MKIIRGLHNLKRIEASALAIGNFDGVHLGHQQLLKCLIQASKRLNAPSIVLTFEPLPREYFSKNLESIPARLTRFREKVKLFQTAGIDYVLVVYFNSTLARLSHEDFLRDILIRQLGVRYLLLGKDFRFGAKRLGDFDYLKKSAISHAFELEALDDVVVNQERASSTRIREHLLQDELQAAEQLLGRPYDMLGRVVHGQKLGRTLGFPTANIHLHRAKTPVHGIYAVKVYDIDAEPLLGVANVGERPTVGGTRTLLEIFIFNFNRDIYGRKVRVEFAHKLRDEAHYDSLDLLKAQIAKDVAEAKQFFALPA